MATPLLRPAPLVGRTALAVEHDADLAQAAADLQSGRPRRVADHFYTGLSVLDALRARLPAPPDDAPYGVRRAWRRAFRDAALNLWVPVSGHAVAIEGAPDLRLLAELYPELDAFDLPLVQVQELAGADKRHQHGVHLAVLGHRVHPFYGTYAPTRTEHLELFATWLARYDGAHGNAVDVGTGCGVLALMLARAGFAHIVATDENPNAAESVARELARLDPRPPVMPAVGDLLADLPGPFELIAFNPPWTQGQADSLIDRALSHAPDLFPRFFDQAHDRLAPGGRVVLLFSNIMQLSQPDLPHPIETELAAGRFVLDEKLRRRVKPTDGRRTRERVELWVLRRA